MPAPSLTDDQLVQLYQEAINEIDVEDLEDNGKRWEIPAAYLRREIQAIFLALRQEEGISATEFGKLLITNGLSAIAVANYREKNQ